MKTLIVYYSLTGTTEKVAKNIASIIDADTIRIEGFKDYGSFDDACRIGKEEFDSVELPEVKTEKVSLEGYDRLLVGFPLWYYKAPMLVISFLEELDLNGIDIYPFCTSGSQDVNGSVSQIKELNLDAVIHAGHRFNGNVSEKEVNDWLNNN